MTETLRLSKSETAHAMTLAGLNLIQQALTIYDEHLRLVICNRRFAEMFDLPDKLTSAGSSFEETMWHLVKAGEYGEISDPDAFVTARIETAKAFQPHYMERRRANGKIISVEGTPLPKGGWVAVYTDITDIKEQEELLRLKSQELSGELGKRAAELTAKNRELAAINAALEEAKRELTEIEARTRQTTEMIPAHIAYVDNDLRYSFSNGKLNEIMPGRTSKIIGRRVSETLGAQTYAHVERLLLKALDGEASTFEFDDEISSRRIRVSLTPDTREGKVLGAYILSTDVTEETQARTALQQASRRQMAAQLTSGLAHDFSNLLTIILGAHSRLARHSTPSKETDAALRAIKESAERGGTLLNTIAEMTNERDLRLEPVEAATFLEKINILAQSTLSDTVNFSVRNKLPQSWYMLDEGHLQDAILNLILNSKDALGGTGKIVLTVQEIKNTWIEFVVTDNGAGFSQEALRSAVRPFYTTKGSDGTGLGLTMVYDIAKSVGGEIKIGNNYAGARVSLRLPRKRTDPKQETGLALLVEDSQHLRDQIRSLLTSDGYSVVEASSVKEAQLLIEGLPEISFCLCDLNLVGDGTGVDLARDQGDAGIPFVFMSSLPSTDILYKQALKLGPVLPKSFETSDLMAALYSVRTE